MTVDPVTAFYDEHPYPPPVADLSQYADRWRDGTRRRIEHHRLWPSKPLWQDPAILVAGCGTSQAAKYAVRYPESRVVGVDVSHTSIDHTRELAQRHGLDNLELRVMPIPQVADLGESFDHVVCTGVLHHLADPEAGISALRDVLAPGGAMHLMVYATYGRTGVYMIQEYCRRLGIGTSHDEVRDLVATLREIPLGHPLSHLLRDTPDFRQPDALADALLHPRDRSYSVPEVFELLGGANLQFGRWVRQAPYSPACGLVASTPHGQRIAALPIEAQYAAVELFRGTMTRHSFIAHGEDTTTTRPSRLSFSASDCAHYIPIRPSTVISIEERLPPGAAAALLNRAHEFTDLVLFVPEAEKAVFEAIDGRRTIGQVGGRSDFFQRLYEHDLIVIDASGS